MSDLPEVRAIKGEPFRLYVRSKTKANDEYLVDLEELRGNGQCSCPRFHFSCLPALRSNGMKPSPKTRCSHILKARDWWTDRMIKRISDEFNQRQKNRPAF